MLTKKKNTRLVVRICYLKNVEREKLYKDVKFQFSDNIVHIENPSVLKELKVARTHDNADTVVERNETISCYFTGKDALEVMYQVEEQLK